MKSYHKNPRHITDKSLEDLELWLDELGDLSGIVHDLNSDEIPAGNQRSKIFGIIKDEGAITLTEQLSQPTRQGTVARGYVRWHGEQYNYRQVRWTPEQCERANLIANKAGGLWDWDVLAHQFDKWTLLESGFEEADLFAHCMRDFPAIEEDDENKEDDIGNKKEDSASVFVIHVGVGASEYYDEVLENITTMRDQNPDWKLDVT